MVGYLASLQLRGVYQNSKKTQNAEGLNFYKL